MNSLYTTPEGFAPSIEPRLYERSCREALQSPEAFWGQVGQRLTWSKPYTTVMDVSFNRDDFRIRWYQDGELNVSANCLDRHLQSQRNKPAII